MTPQQRRAARERWSRHPIYPDIAYQPESLVVLDELDRRDAVLADLQRLAEHGKWDELRRALRGEVERVMGAE